MIVVDVGNEFSMTPGGRYRSEGAYSGEEFRETYLEPHVTRRTAVVVDLDSARGFSTSFLEECFGGLVRKFGADTVRKYVTVRARKKPWRAEAAVGFIDRAARA